MQKKQFQCEGVKPESMDADHQEELVDELAHFTIMLSLLKLVYFNVKDTSDGVYAIVICHTNNFHFSNFFVMGSKSIKMT